MQHAQLLTGFSRLYHITSNLVSPHRLLERSFFLRIDFKILLITFKARLDMPPS